MSEQLPNSELLGVFVSPENESILWRVSTSDVGCLLVAISWMLSTHSFEGTGDNEIPVKKFKENLERLMEDLHQALLIADPDYQQIVRENEELTR